MVEKKEWIDKNEHAWSGESGPSVLLTTLRSTRVSNASREAAYDDVQNFGLLRQPALNAGCYSRLQLRIRTTRFSPVYSDRKSVV